MRLKKGAKLAQVNAQLRTISARLTSVFTGVAAGSELAASQIKPRMVADVRSGLLILLGAVVRLVLVIACVNVSCLLLARSSARQKEIAIRVALGATRRRIIVQLLGETTILALLGGGLGALFAIWSVKGLHAIAPPDTPRLDQLGIDLNVLLFTLAISLLAGFLFGLAPALFRIIEIWHRGSNPRKCRHLIPHCRLAHTPAAFTECTDRQRDRAGSRTRDRRCACYSQLCKIG